MNGTTMSVRTLLVVACSFLLSTGAVEAEGCTENEKICDYCVLESEGWVYNYAYCHSGEWGEPTYEAGPFVSNSACSLSQAGFCDEHYDGGGN